ncbi:MAG: Rrf2 family transcriptional regulator [Candidatus Omnitrophica bacterium]|nr:Rrf2 family transcriptional regulator [Candidatus Omnitrophota bacterium]
MKLTTKSEYALLALIHLARRKDNGYVKMEEIGEKYDLSKKYLIQIFNALRQSRYIKTRRGANGGFMLAKKPEKISLAEVVRLMDGALAPTLSVSKYFFESNPLEKENKVINVMKEIRDYVSKKVESIKISDLL